jgi:hypothetical protein
MEPRYLSRARASALALGETGVVVILWGARLGEGERAMESMRYQPQLFWISIVLLPGVRRTWPAGMVVQVVVAGRLSCEPPALLRTMLVNLSPLGPL